MNGYYHHNFYNSNNRRQKQNQYSNCYFGPDGNPQPLQYPFAYGSLHQVDDNNRAFHDAIYEEEYGSDRDDECCQSRGMSAIFCWLMSVIILIGLAASIVLTVLFLLKTKSYSSKPEELDLLLDGESGNIIRFPDSSSTILNNVETTITTETSRTNGNSKERYRTTPVPFGARTTTRFPPSRKGPHQIFETSEEKGSLPFQNLYPNGKFSSSERNAILSTQRTQTSKENEQKNVSHEHLEETQSPLTTTTTSRPIVFTAPPSSATTSGSNRRNLLTTRFTTERTSFTSSTEAEDSDQEESEQNDDESESDNESAGTNGHSVRPPLAYETRGTTTTVQVTPSTVDRDDITYSGEESQLNKMLHDEIPPNQNSNKEEDDEIRKSTEFQLPTTPDPRARIIKNLGPKWGKNRTVETTTMTSGTYKYDFTISSREKGEKEKSSEKKASKEMGGKGEKKTSSEFKREKNSGINSVESPNLGKDKDSKESPFLDVLVGSEDQKTLVTKKTEDGIVTAAILPPWYNAGNNVSAADNATSSSEEESSEVQRPPTKDADSSESSSVLGGIFSFFKNLNNDRPFGHNQREPFDPKRIVLKRPGGALLPINVRGPPPLPISASSEESLERDKIHTILPSNIMTTTITPDAVVTDDDILPANNAFHYGTSDGATNIYGYYPDEDKDNDQTVEHHVLQSESISDPNELIPEQSVEKKLKPSHSIELDINPDASSEVVIEQEDQGQEQDDEYHFARYGEAHASSEIRNHVVEAPKTTAVPARLGGGIRRPVNGERVNDLEMKGSENRPTFANSRVNNIRHQLIRQRGPVSANNSTTTTSSTTTASTPLSKENGKDEGKLALVSEEVVDNSAEKDPAVADDNHDFLRKSLKPQQDKIQTSQSAAVKDFYSGSVEHQDAHEEIGTGSTSKEKKWSRPDPNSEGAPDSLENDQEQEHQFGLRADSQSYEEADHHAEHLPHPSSHEVHVANSQSVENKQVFNVFPVGYSSTTTERPATESTISDPNESENTSAGFVPPKPVDFHENLYTFSPPSSDSIYQSKDGWRPLVYSEEDEKRRGTGPTAPVVVTPSTPRPQPAWRERLHGMINRQPLLVTVAPRPGFELNTAATQNFIGGQNNKEEDHADFSDHEPESNENLSWAGEDRDVQQPLSTNAQEPHHSSSQEVSHVPQTQPAQHNHQPQHFHNINNHNQFQRIPIQVPMHQQPQQNIPQGRPPQFQFQAGNPNIDRSKYMVRPALPPIVMRRPVQTMGFGGPNPNPLPPRPQLVPHVQMNGPNKQIFNNNNHNNPVPEFAQQSFINRRRFKTLGSRPRAVDAEGTQQDIVAERRNG